MLSFPFSRARGLLRPSMYRSTWFLALVTVGVVLSACEDVEPLAGTSGTGAGTVCEQGVPLADGTCVLAGVPADKCGDGFVPDGKQGCAPVLPADDCPEGTMPILGMTECQPVGVPPGACGKGFVPDAHAGCAPILPSEDCPDGTMPVIGRTDCQVVGVPMGQCGTGFSSDDKGGCEPILPTDDCPEGTMALPGETDCHAIQSCGSGKYGDIPIDATTQYVDASYAGSDSDGSQERPWVTVQNGVLHAASGGRVAVAAGSYPEDVVISHVGIQVWGVCPEQVRVSGSAGGQGAFVIEAAGVEIHGMTVTGDSHGVTVAAAGAVTLQRLWIKDNFQGGVLVQAPDATTATVILESLISGNHVSGLATLGSAMTVADTVVRGTQNPENVNAHEGGIQAYSDQERPSTLTLTHSVLEKNQTVELSIVGSEAVVDSVVIRNTRPRFSDHMFGRGVEVSSDTSQRSHLSLTASTVQENLEAGLTVVGSDAVVERTVIRDTQPQLSDGGKGWGITLDLHGGQRASLTMTSSLVENNTLWGVRVTGSDATVLSTVVRRTQPGKVSFAGVGGNGISLGSDGEVRASLTMTASLIDQNHWSGVAVHGSDATIEGSVIRATQPAAADMTRGMGAEVGNYQGQQGKLVVTGSLIEQNHAIGCQSLGADLTVQTSVIRDTQPRQSDLQFGEGIYSQSQDDFPGTLVLRDSLLERNHTAALHVEGMDATVERSIFRNTLAQSADMGRGFGVVLQGNVQGPASLTLDSSLLDGNAGMGMYVSGSTARVERTIVRHTQPFPFDSSGGWGIYEQGFDEVRSTLSLDSCLLEGNTGGGLSIDGSDATVMGTAVRETQPQVSDMSFGDGISVFTFTATHVPATLSLYMSILDRNHRAGLGVLGAEATVDSTLVRRTLPQLSDGRDGIGIAVVPEISATGETAKAASGSLSLTRSVVQENENIGILAESSNLTLQWTVVRDTHVQTIDQSFGDGISVVDSKLSVEGSLVRGSERASISNFGSQVTLKRVEVLCSPILFDQELSFTDSSTGEVTEFGKASYNPEQTACFTCDGTALLCKAVSRHLAPPKPIPPLTSPQATPPSSP